MATDLYAKCPCGSGKKIKFCCRDIISDIERIERMLRGEQRTAALDKIEKLLTKHPNRPALLGLKAQVYFELKQIDDAKPVIDQLLEVEPDNPTALAMKAALAAIDGDVQLSLQLLHRAMRMSHGVFSQMVYKAYIGICAHLIQIKEVIAAYAHLINLVSITKGEDRASISMLMNVTSSENLPTIFQGLVISDKCPDTVTWKREFEVVIDIYRHGDWCEAASMLENMTTRILDAPFLLRNLAILQAWTAQYEKAVKTFRLYSGLRGLELDEAVEAEACAQVLESTSEEDIEEVVMLTHEIDDPDATMEKLLSNDTVETIPVGSDPSDPDAPPPKGQFILFDRPQSADSEHVASHDLPRQCGTLAIYGRETDRNARMSFILHKDNEFDTHVDRVCQISGQSINVTATTEVLGRFHKVLRLFRPDFRVPPNTTYDRYHEIEREWIQDRLENAWPKVSQSFFGGQSAEQAARDTKYKKAVLAAIMNLEMWADRQPGDFDFNRLRHELELPIRETIDPSEVDVRSLSPARLGTLDLVKLSDDDLVFVFEVSSVRPNGTLLYRIGRETLNRPNLKDRIDFIEVHERLADLAPSTDVQLEHLQAARDLAVERGDSPAHWLISELDVELSRGEVDLAKRLINEIQSRYLREPGIAQQFGSVLAKYGLLKSGPAAGGAPQDPGGLQPEAAAATAAAAGVWTPDGNEAAPAEAGEKSKLWIPGMD